MEGVALGDHVTCTRFASAALRCHTELELHFIEAHAGACMTGDLSV